MAAKGWSSPRPIPPKRSFAPIDEPDHSSTQPSTTKKLRTDSEDAEQEVKWVESTSGSAIYQGRFWDEDLMPRRLTKSAPNVAYPRDVDGFVVLTTPASTRSSSYGQSFALYNAAGSASSNSGRSSRISLVEDPNYREMNLAANNIYMYPLLKQFPENITSLVDYVGRDRDSPGPSPDQIRQDAGLHQLCMGTNKTEVEDYFTTNIFPKPELSNSLKRTDRHPMVKRTVPEFRSDYKISTPMPDMLYGYSRNGAFPQQQAQLLSMGTEMIANSQSLIYPFFVIEFKADGPSESGSLWVATNQCLGGSTTCVNITERLNLHLKQYKDKKVQLINSAVFSIAMNGTEARLYISWKHDELKFYMALINGFLLYRPDHYMEFRKYVRNIIDWGKDKHLKEIQDSLDTLLEESFKSRRETSELAKSCQSTLDDSTSSSSRQRRTLLGKGDPPTYSRRGNTKGSSFSAGDGNS